MKPLSYITVAFMAGSICHLALARDAICQNARECEVRGTKALNIGDMTSAENFFIAEIEYAEDKGSKSESIKGYNNITLVYIKSHDYQDALKWTQYILTIDPKNRTANYHLNLITASYKLSRRNNEIYGVYVKYAGRNYWDELRIFRTDSKAPRFSLTLYRIGQAWRTYGPSQLGNVKGTLEKEAGHGFVYKSDSDFPSCRIHFMWVGDDVALSQDDDCGFGYGLQADATFKRIANGK